MSSGAILIGQDLLREASPKALEAAIAHQLCRVKYNHENKEWVIKWIMPVMVGCFLRAPNLPGSPVPDLSPRDRARYGVLSFIALRVLLAKRFEKQADRFVYEEMGNAEGLIELCTYWQHKEQRVDTEYDDVSEYLRTSNIALIDYIFYDLGYHFRRTGHRLHKLNRWIFRNTPLGSNQSYQTRINTAQQYLNVQNNQ